jgi:hypothetical protein
MKSLSKGPKLSDHPVSLDAAVRQVVTKAEQ